MSPTQLAALIALGAIWGASYIFIRVAVEPFGPAPLMFIRVALSAMILLAYARLRRIPLDIRRHWRRFLLLGFFASALPFTLIGWAELTVTASLAAILMSTTPLFTALVAAVGLGERLTLYKLIGALLGIIGVTLTVGGAPMEMNAEALAATAALLAATFSYSLGGVFAKRSFSGVNSMSLSTGQLIGSAFILAPVSLVDLPPQEISSAALLAVLALVVFCTAVAYQLYYYLIISAGPIKALTVTLLVPIFGVIWGALFLRERISPGMIAGLLIVLFSVGLVTGMISPQSRRLGNKNPSSAARSAATNRSES